MLRTATAVRALCASRQLLIFARPSSSSAEQSNEKEPEEGTPQRPRRLPRREPENENQLVHIAQQFEATPRERRDKQAFMGAIALFKDKKLRNHVEFIETALRFVKEFGVHKDLEAYKALLNVFPKGPLIPTNPWQRIFLHYPRQQNCCVKVLDTLEWHGVQPDKELHDIVVNAFGEWNFATKKAKRMLYWMPKLKYSNKYLDRRTVEGKKLSAAELAARALKMISRDPATDIQCFKEKSTKGETQDDKEKTEKWVVNAQSPLQQLLLSKLDEGSEVFVDGPFRVYVMEHPVQYVSLTSAPNPAAGTGSGLDALFQDDIDPYRPDYLSSWQEELKKPYVSIHEQADATILALGALSKNDNDSARQWIEELRLRNPNIDKVQVRYRLATLPLRV